MSTTEQTDDERRERAEKRYGYPLRPGCELCACDHRREMHGPDGSDPYYKGCRAFQCPCAAFTPIGVFR